MKLDSVRSNWREHTRSS